MSVDDEGENLFFKKKKPSVTLHIGSRIAASGMSDVAHNLTLKEDTGYVC